jgi:hypothetical protein
MEARLLAAKSEFGYTERIDRALKDEPEAVSPEEQRRQTRAAARGAADRAKLDWAVRHDHLQAELTELSRQPYARGLSPELRLMTRQLAKLDKLIGTALAN